MILMVTIGWGIWYYTATNDKEHSTKDATLVWMEWEEKDAGYYIY